MQENFHAQALGLVGEFEAHAAMRPLVYLLVVHVTNIGLLPKIAHIANHERSHACLLQRGDEPARLLMLDVFDLMLYFLELLLLGTDDALTALGSSPHLAINTAVETRLQFVAILDLGTQEPTVEDVRLRSIVGDRHMYLTQVDARHLVALWLYLGEWSLIGGNRLIFLSRPVDNHCVWQVPGPG